jgi:hypothetical protein
VTYTFNPPPGWPPLPPGWNPPLGWRPEPFWPPVPAGWRLWVPASGTRRCRSRSAWLQRHGVGIAALLGTLVLVLVLATSVSVRRGSLSYAGTGPSLVALSLDPALRHLATITHDGSATFRVTALAESGREIARLVDDAGAYSGVHHLNPVDTPAAVRIEADGPWRMAVESRPRR